MSTTKRVLLGLGAVWPLVYIPLFFLLVFIQMPSGPTDEGPSSGFFLTLFPLHFFTILLTFGMSIYFLINAIRRDEFDTTKKIIWALCLFQLSIFTMPVYWYLYFWRDREALRA